MAALGTTMREQVFSKSALMQISSPGEGTVALGRSELFPPAGSSYQTALASPMLPLCLSPHPPMAGRLSPSQKPFLSI